MQGNTGWHYRPYRPANRIADAGLPFICRLAPEADAAELEWLDANDPGAHIVKWRVKGSDACWDSAVASGFDMRIEALETDRDYEVCVVREKDPEASSAIRFFRTGDVPGRVVNYLHPEDELYAFSGRSLCSPSLILLPSGALLASMDLYAPGGPQNLTLLFRSDDRGRNWRYVTDLFPCYWGTLFLHGGRLYMLGCSTEYGDVLIGASDDEGTTWTPPTHVFSGSSSTLSAGWQRTPMPIVRTHGRFFFSVDYGAWTQGGHSVGMLSIPEDADLLDSRNWTCSDLISYDPSWPGAPRGKSNGLLEGNLVMSKDGRLLDLLRIELTPCTPSHGIATVLEADPERPEAAMTFHRFVSMPSGSNSKSHVLYDSLSKKYIAIGNICVDPATPGQRNVLALQASEDLYDWYVAKILLDYRHESPGKVGFQYISFLMDGDDLLYLSRTSMNGSRNFHDANYSTFHVIDDFRQYL